MNEPGFQKLLFAVYLLNDIFFAARTKEDPFRRSFAPVLSDIIRGASKAADNDASRDKLVKVIELWGAKKVFNSEQIEELKVAAKNEPVPVATVQDQRCDLSTIPVGVMAGLVKVALNGGHEPWRPLDLTTMPTAAPMPVEPGRLEARVKEFYRLLEKDKLRRAAQQKPPSSHNDEEEDPEHRAQQDDRKRRRAYEQLDSGTPQEGSTRTRRGARAWTRPSVRITWATRCSSRWAGARAASARAAPASRSPSTCGSSSRTRASARSRRSSSSPRTSFLNIERSGRRSTGAGGGPKSVLRMARPRSRTPPRARWVRAPRARSYARRSCFAFARRGFLAGTAVGSSGSYRMGTKGLGAIPGLRMARPRSRTAARWRARWRVQQAVALRTPATKRRRRGTGVGSRELPASTYIRRMFAVASMIAANMRPIRFMQAGSTLDRSSRRRIGHRRLEDARVHRPVSRGTAYVADAS